MPRKEDLKNWKIKECFISDRDGWCNHCKTRTWKKGHKIYWMEKPNGSGWAACTDKKCYQEQGGKITPVERKKKDTPKNIGLDEFRWPSNEVEIPEVEAKLPGEEPPKAEKHMYPFDCNRCHTLIGYCDTNYADTDERYQDHYCTSCIVTTIRENKS